MTENERKARQADANARRWKRRREDGETTAFQTKERFWEQVARDYRRADKNKRR